MAPKYKKHDDLVKNLTFCNVSGRFRFRDPVTKKRFWLGRNKDAAIKKATKLNIGIDLILEKKQLEEGAPHTVRNIINLYLACEIDNKPWAKDTRYRFECRLKIIKEKFGDKSIVALDRLVIADFLSKRDLKADNWNQWRGVFVELYRFAISKKIVSFNEGEAVLTRSTSKKLAANQKTRLPLTLDQYKATLKKAQPCLSIAMRMSLVTLQARKELVNMQYPNIRDGYIYLIRDKVAGDSDMAFIRIELTPQIEALIEESKLDIRGHVSTLCPYVIHRKSLRQKPGKAKTKPHDMYVTADYLSKDFHATLVKACPELKDLGPQCPSFHEIRGLGSRLYEDLGYEKEGYIRPLMAHSDKKTTEIYLSGGQLRDEHFFKVHADLQLKDILT